MAFSQTCNMASIKKGVAPRNYYSTGWYITNYMTLMTLVSGEWLLNLINNRSQRLATNDDLFKETSVSSGEPRGTVQDPLLFTAALWDLLSIIQSPTFTGYADDAKVSQAIKSSQDTLKLQKDLSTIYISELKKICSSMLISFMHSAIGLHREWN